jgi:hypothetical protein
MPYRRDHAVGNHTDEGLVGRVETAHGGDRLPYGLGHRRGHGPGDTGATRGFGDGDPQRRDGLVQDLLLGDPRLDEVGDDLPFAGAPGGAGDQLTRLGKRLEHREGHRLGRVGIGAQRGRIQLPQHLTQGAGGLLTAADDSGVGKEQRLDAEHLLRGRLWNGGEDARLQRPGKADRPALGRAGADLIRRAVVGEALGEVLGGFGAGVRDVATGSREKLGDRVVVACRSDPDTRRVVAALCEQRAEFGVAAGIVGDLADFEQPAGVVDDRDRQPTRRFRGERGTIRRRQSAVHPNERHRVLLLPGTGFRSRQPHRRVPRRLGLPSWEAG